MFRILTLLLWLIAAAGGEDGVELLLLGDQGTGDAAQRRVAAAMATFAAGRPQPIAATLLLGDNVYGRLRAGDDAGWRRVFDDVYDAQRLPMPFWALLGNHDYRTGPFANDRDAVLFDLARRHPEGRFRLPARWYRIDLPDAVQPLVSVLMLDGNFRFIDAAAQQAWLDAELAKPRPPWLIAACHFPLFSDGAHGDDAELIARWGPTFRRARLDFYLCGHDHDLQHLELPGWPISFVVCGGGGGELRPLRRDDRGPFARSMHGFGDIRCTAEAATVRLIGDDGVVVHAFRRGREGTVTLLPTAAALAAP